MKSAKDTIDALVQRHDAGEKADRLSLVDRELEKVPDAVWDMTWLKTLNLDDNPLFEIDERIARLTELKTLSAESTKLRSLPRAINTLPKLERVSLRYTELESIPDWFAPPRLKELFLDAMTIRELPASLGGVKTLRRLWLWRFFDMEDARVAGFVSSIGALSQLTHAGFLQGRLKQLPEDLSMLSGLKQFKMGLDEIPASEVERLRRALPDGVLHVGY